MFFLYPYHVRQEALSADLAQVQEEYANSKDNSRKTIQVSFTIRIKYNFWIINPFQMNYIDFRR